MLGCCRGREALCGACTAMHKAEIKAAIGAGRMRPYGPQRLSPACMAFVSAMLTRDPKQRPSARLLLQVGAGASGLDPLNPEYTSPANSQRRCWSVGNELAALMCLGASWFGFAETVTNVAGMQPSHICAGVELPRALREQLVLAAC